MYIQHYALKSSDAQDITLLEVPVPGTGVHKVHAAFAADLFDLIDQLFVKLVPADGLTFTAENVPGLALTKDGWMNGDTVLGADLAPAPNGRGDFAIGFRIGTIEVLTPGTLKMVACLAPNGDAHPGVAAFFHLAALHVVP